VSVKQLKVFAPASIANLGPGFDVFGIALDGLGDIIEAEQVDEPGILIEVNGVGAGTIPVNASENSAGAVFLHILGEKGLHRGFHVRISKGVPPGKGLGSSGASAAAAAVAVDRLLDLGLSARKLVELAAMGEAAVAGSAHADNVSASIFGGFTIVDEVYDVIRMNPPRIGVAVASPEILIENKTKVARSLLPEMIGMKDAVRNIGYASRMSAAVALGDTALFGKSIGDAFVEPFRAKIIPHFWEVKKAALDAGAYGCSIAGGGPSVFAVGEDVLSIGKAMAEAFGDIRADVLITKPSVRGATVI
jgi:homoserine kinase